MNKIIKSYRLKKRWVFDENSPRLSFLKPEKRNKIKNLYYFSLKRVQDRKKKLKSKISGTIKKLTKISTKDL
jgi:hypothetical protein